MTATTAPRPGYTQPLVAWNGLTVTDLFCGAGGSSSGLVAAGYRVVIAANHWKQAIASHEINHPDTKHSSADISQVTPSYFPRTDVLWASPECTNHSIAKGVKRQRAEDATLFELNGTRPLSDDAANRSRATMWDVPRFAEYHRYRAIIIENVVDAYRWVQFPAWIMAMELLGYEHEIVWQNSMHAQAAGLPAPQSRDRMYIVFWRKDRKTRTGGTRRPDLQKWTRPEAFCEEHGVVRAVQTFKKAERWGRYRQQYVYRCPSCAVVVEPGWLPAASIIDWSIRGERIGDKPLKEYFADKAKTKSLGFHRMAPKTIERTRLGVQRHWTPTLVAAAGNTYDSASGKPGSYLRARPVSEVLPTQSTTVADALAVPPLLIPVEGREGKVAALATDPLRTQSTRNETAIVVPLRNHGVAKPITHPIDTVAANGNHHALVMRNNHGGAEMTTPATEPLRTLTTGGHQSLLVPYYGTGIAKPTSEPVGTLTAVDRYALAEAASFDVNDVEFRMLEPHEIKLGMAFAHDYVLLGTKREQVKQSGNAVTPPNARDLGYAVAEFLVGEELVAA
jgi:DNA (cytosine-5)-methyltransferase 1